MALIWIIFSIFPIRLYASIVGNSADSLQKTSPPQHHMLKHFI